MEMREAIAQTLEFRDERDWKQFHNPKDLAISICLESAELLELFQWSTSDDLDEEIRSKLEAELADILIYSIYLADIINVDLSDIILNKIKLNENRYPVNKARGTTKKYTRL